MIEWLWTKDKNWFEKWDKFNDSTPRGNYLQLSDWLFSYQSFGFEIELLIGLENGEICIGCAVIKAKYLSFKFHVINCGPIIKEGYDTYFDEAIQIFLKKAKKDGAFYCHICPPILETGNLPFALPQEILKSDSIYLDGKKGIPFKIVFSPAGLLWVDLDYKTEEDRLAAFSANTKRDIRASLRKGVKMVEAETGDQIKEAYNSIELNAKAKGFSVRPWNEFQNYLLESHRKGFARFLIAYKDGECKGAMLLLKVNRKYTYMMGGANREKPDLLVGAFLQWEAMKILMNEGLKGYDISLGGSKSVMDFKLSFNPVVYSYVQSRHWVLSPIKFAIYSKLNPIVIKNRKLIVSFMKIIKKGGKN